MEHARKEIFNQGLWELTQGSNEQDVGECLGYEWGCGWICGSMLKIAWSPENMWYMSREENRVVVVIW